MISVVVVGAWAAAPTASSQVALHALHEGLSGPGDQLGIALSNAGDADGDGYDDIAVGVRFYDCFGQDNSGAVFMVSGRTGGTIWARCGQDDAEVFGSSLDFIGDVDGDGLDDLIVGAVQGALDGSGLNPKGRFYVLSGDDGSDIHAPVDGSQANEWLGHRVAGVGNIDGDSVPDYAVSALFGDNPSGTPAGFVRVYAGATNSPLFTIYGSTAGDDMGSSIDGIPDLDGDGRDEVLIGESRAHVALPYVPGRAHVVSGMTGAVMHTFVGAAGDAFGVSVADAGDVDGDLAHDIIVGANEEHLSKVGYADVYSGSGWGFVRRFQGLVADDEFGRVVAGVGDFNCDGFDDVAVGSAFDDSGSFVDGGSARVFSVLDGIQLFVKYGDSAGDHLEKVAGGGDVNRDGIPDLVVGATNDDVQGSDSGSAYVFPGLPTGCVNDTSSLDANGNGLPDDCESWTDLGSALAGVSDKLPLLVGSGFLIEGKPIRLDLMDAKPLTLCWLVVGTAASNVPFFGGVLVPTPTNLLQMFTDSSGSIALEALWPAGIPAGSEVYVQYWLVDSAGVAGFAASNALKGVAP